MSEDDDVRSVEYKGNLYWMQKLEANELISEILEDLKSECLGGKYSGCFYTMDSYKLHKKWEKRLPDATGEG